jgi:hypothetical protein
MSHVSDPARVGLAVTPSDVTILNPTRALYIGTTGNLTVRMYGSQNNVTFTTVPVGIFPIQVDRVLATGTTATNIVALG